MLSFILAIIAMARGKRNLALFCKAFQSTTLRSKIASFAVDGNDNTYSWTIDNQRFAVWWVVQLNKSYVVETVSIDFVLNYGNSTKTGWYVLLMNDFDMMVNTPDPEKEVTCTKEGEETDRQTDMTESLEIKVVAKCDSPLPYRFVAIWSHPKHSFEIWEVRVYGAKNNKMFSNAQWIIISILILLNAFCLLSVLIRNMYRRNIKKRKTMEVKRPKAEEEIEALPTFTLNDYILDYVDEDSSSTPSDMDIEMRKKDLKMSEIYQKSKLAKNTRSKNERIIKK